jgi:predicted NBD/HSP70 family sugar kinase
MAFGEYMSGIAGDARTVLFLNVGWGLGMGMVMDGKLYYGKSGFSGEVGHFPLLDNNCVCQCGKVGCLETGASGSALCREIEEKLAEGRPSSLSAIYASRGEIDLEDILKAIQEEDMIAIEGIGKVGETLGRGISGILNIFNPGLVVVGGRLIVGKDYLMLPIKTAVNKMSLHKVTSDTRFMLSRLGRKAAGLGDCLLARAKFLDLM